MIGNIEYDEKKRQERIQDSTQVVTEFALFRLIDEMERKIKAMQRVLEQLVNKQAKD